MIQGKYYTASTDSSIIYYRYLQNTIPISEELKCELEHNYLKWLSENSSNKSENKYFVLNGNTNISAGQTIKINKLVTKNLSVPFDVYVQPDDSDFIAEIPKLSLFGFGDTMEEAVENIKYELESLYNDLNQDDDFTEDWLEIRDFLNSRVVD